jgi:hypothetical protein
MEPESSVPFSQEYATGPYPKPDESSPHTLISYVFRIKFNIIYTLRLGLSSGLFPSGFSTKIL